MNFLKVLVIIAFIVLTIITLQLHPDMHQPVLIEDADFKLTRISDTLTTKNIPVSSSIQKPKTTEKIVQQPANLKEVQKELKIQNQQPAQTQTKYIATQDQKTTQQTVSTPVRSQKTKKQIKPENTQPESSQIELLESILAQAEQEEKQQKQEQVQPAQQNNNFKNPYMSQQEEIIAWNKWRSNLQNQIMKDSQIDYAPLGTLFLFTFVVDKFGNISNIKVECSNPNYMDVARNNVKPAIANLQKKPILNFPKGTQRTSTVVTGVFLIGTQERYSTPNDFSDYERVTY